MIKQSSFQVDFDLNANDDDLKDLAVDFLPCQFEKDIEETNRDIYFDPCIQKSAEH